MQRFLDVFATPREAGGLKVPHRRENEEHGNDGGDQAVATEFADKAQLQVYKVHRRDHRGLDYGAAPPSRRTVKTVNSAPIMRASLRVMARPSPVPPRGYQSERILN